MNFCAILNGDISSVIWAYTLDSIKESIKLHSHLGEWKIYILVRML